MPSDVCLAGGIRGDLTEAVKLRVKRMSYSQDMWDEELTWMSLVLNSAIHESTNCTPDKLFLGREIKSPLVDRWDLTHLATDGTVSDSKSFWAQAYGNLKRACENVAKRYNECRKPRVQSR
jgi:hypothetical protein